MSSFIIHPSHFSQSMNVILGSVSIICWVIVGWPQMLQNYRDKSAEGLSLSFILIWLTGDMFNIAAALLDRDFVLSILLVGLWYVIMDVALLFQIFYYGRGKSVTERSPSEKTPLRVISTPMRTMSLAVVQSPFMGSPRSYIRSPATPSYATRHSYQQYQTSYTKTQLCAMCLSVCAVGTVGWLNLPNSEIFWTDSQSLSSSTARVLHSVVKKKSGDSRAIVTQVCGWICTLFYVGSRIPQLVKNYMRQSCEGLSVWMFVFAVLGNFFFTLSLLVISVEPAYLAEKAWAITGALGTLGFDFTIFCQYFWYSSKGKL